MKNKNTVALSPYALFLFRLFAIALAALIICASVNACPTCDKAQPRILRGITHGAGPQNNWDYTIALAVMAVTILVGYYSVKWLIRPGETAPGHIKYYILHNDAL